MVFYAVSKAKSETKSLNKSEKKPSNQLSSQISSKNHHTIPQTKNPKITHKIVQKMFTKKSTKKFHHKKSERLFRCYTSHQKSKHGTLQHQKLHYLCNGSRSGHLCKTATQSLCHDLGALHTTTATATEVK